MKFDYPASKIADILGMHVGSIWRIHSRFFKHAAKIFRNAPKGGRLHENLTREGKATFLRPFVEDAEKSGILIITQLQRAYENRINKKAPKSTIYRDA